MYHQNNNGFIALISVVILGVVMLAAVVSLAQYGIGTRYALLDLERKAESESLASACIEVVRIAILNDPLYSATNVLVNVGTSTKRCLIESVVANTPSSGSSQAKVSASSTKANTNLKAVIQTSSGNITKIEEIPTF